MKEKWMLAAKRAPFLEIAEKYRIDPVTARLIRNRDIIGDDAIEAYLYGGLERLHSPWQLKDMDKAVTALQEKIAAGKRIRIIGDYDIDGICATYILTEGLGALGADVDWDIPDRMRDGYGLNIQLVQKAYEEGTDTILTCDNGISAAKQVSYARALGMTVIVTDHHEVPFTLKQEQTVYHLPPAQAVIDPKQADCPYPYAGICGAVVAWKLVQALFERAHRTDYERFLPFAAIATVGDVMDLKDENRIIVKEGLQSLHETQHVGLRALMEACGLPQRGLTAYHIGFVLGPCFNASGRLHTAKLAMALLQSESREEAISYAQDLKALNEERKELTARAVKQALDVTEGTGLKNDRVLVVYLPDCHESIAGIVAGRLRERYQKPVFVLTRGEHSLKGSGRSIESYSMFEKLSECKDLLLAFGGHPMAAGLSLEKGNLETLRRRLNEKCGLTEEDFTEKIMIDADMPIDYVREDLIREFALLEPFGKGNPKPLFAQKNLCVLHYGLIGKNQNVLRMQVLSSAGRQMQAVCFQNVQELLLLLQERDVITAAYYPEVNEYRGRQSLQIVITHFA